SLGQQFAFVHRSHSRVVIRHNHDERDPGDVTGDQHMVDTYLPPIERAHGVMMKLVYFLTRRQFGKVLTPLKVYSARLPPDFGMFYAKVAKLDEKLLLPQELVRLIREQVARINVCSFCIDIGRWDSMKKSMNQAKFDALDHYGTSPLFTDAERAALDYATELTKDK